MVTKLEYKVIYKNQLAMQEPELNRLGSDGWELVSVMRYVNGDTFYYFKRPVNLN